MLLSGRPPERPAAAVRPVAVGYTTQPRLARNPKSVVLPRARTGTQHAREVAKDANRLPAWSITRIVEASTSAPSTKEDSTATRCTAA